MNTLSKSKIQDNSVKAGKTVVDNLLETGSQKMNISTESDFLDQLNDEDESILDANAVHNEKLATNQKSFIEFDKSSADISKDFVRQHALGISEPFCERPWRRLEIKVRDNRTKVCCDFAVKLPEFKWPSIEEFHDENHMWNHPFMQHMRRTLGLPNEVPYCKLCLTTNKRASQNSQKRSEARLDTIELYDKFEKDLLRKTYRGRLNNFEETIDEYVYSYGTDIQKNIFRNTVDEYRDLVRKRGFNNIGNVLQIGGLGAISPFLAEANTNFTGADFVESKVVFTSNLLKDFGLNDDGQLLDKQGMLPFEDQTFDGIWLQGSLLYSSNRLHFLNEIHRILRYGGRIFVRTAFGLGELLERILANSDRKNLDTNSVSESVSETDLTFQLDYIRKLNAVKNLKARDGAIRHDAKLAREAILNGFHYNGFASFFQSNKIRPVLRKFGFEIDIAYPAVPFPHKQISSKAVLKLKSCDPELYEAIYKLSGQKKSGQFEPTKLERYINFSAIKNPIERSQ